MKFAARVACFLSCTCFVLPVAHGQDADKLFSAWDKNGDGVLEAKEVPAGPREIFSAVDRNGDGKVTLAEHRRGPDRDQLQQMRGRELSPAAKDRVGQKEANSIPSVRDAKVAEFSIRQTWDQEPVGIDRPVYVRMPSDTGNKKQAAKLPVVIFFHGNGGQASRSISGWRELNPCVFVVPQGYERSWNIFGERSLAPDVQFVQEIINEIPKRFSNADMDNVTVIGSSNGGGFIYRLMIEMETIPFRLAVPTVSSLIVQQYHDGAFWRPSESTKNYDRKQTWPAGRKWPTVLYFHGTKDSVVPYRGGMRGRVRHVSAEETAYALAKAIGYRGATSKEKDLKEIEPGLIAFEYPQQNVTLFRMTDAPHGMWKYRRAAAQLILKAMK